jgi:hypothetical protein
LLLLLLLLQVCKEVQESHGKLLKDWIKGITGGLLGWLGLLQGHDRRPTGYLGVQAVWCSGAHAGAVWGHQQSRAICYRTVSVSNKPFLEL